MLKLLIICSYIGATTGEVRPPNISDDLPIFLSGFLMGGSKVGGGSRFNGHAGRHAHIVNFELKHQGRNGLLLAYETMSQA